LTSSREAPRSAAGPTERSADEVYRQIWRELQVFRDRLGLLAQSDERDAATADHVLPAVNNDPHKRQLLSKVAADIYALRRRRNRHLPLHLVGEPAWDLLLSFFMEPSRSQTVGNACIAADVPTTTALRWITLLEQDGILTRSSAREDRRMVVLTLTDKGGLMMEECLGSMLSP